MLWSFDSLLAYYTTGTSLASFLVSRFYSSCYNVLSSLIPFAYLPKEDKRSSFGFELYSIVKVLAELRFTQKLISATISILYKRAFRKEKEVVTFLIKSLRLNLPIFW